MLGMDAARTPHGDGNACACSLELFIPRMQPAPLTGTATCRTPLVRRLHQDAARTPHGDGNRVARVIPFNGMEEMQPTPLTGTATELMISF